MLLSSGHSSRSRINLALFGSAAILGGTVSYALLGAAGSLVPGLGSRTLAATLLVGAVLSGAWYLRPRLRRLPSSRRQLRRDLVQKPYGGAIVFGAVLGVGWLTVVVTPFVWVGLAASVASGSTLWAALYGLGFGSGRAVQLLVHYLAGTDDPEETVLRTVARQARLSQVLGLVGAALLVAGVLTSQG